MLSISFWNNFDCQHLLQKIANGAPWLSYNHFSLELGNWCLCSVSVSVALADTRQTHPAAPHYTPAHAHTPETHTHVLYHRMTRHVRM